MPNFGYARVGKAVYTLRGADYSHQSLYAVSREAIGASSLFYEFEEVDMRVPDPQTALSHRFTMSRRSLLRTSAVVGAGAAMATSPYGRAALASMAAQKSSGIAIFSSAVDIPNIDPAVGHDGSIAMAQKHLYDTLYRHQGNPPELVPWLAKDHSVNDDATEWTFNLDERATFADGSPVTAEAVVYSLQRVLEINRGIAWMFADIVDADGITAPDEHTVKFVLNKPYAPFLHATAWLFILNPAIVDENEKDGDRGQEWLTNNAAGSGPFTISRWEPGNLYQFDANPDYWRGWESDYLEGFVYQVSEESSTKRLALQQGDIQLAEWLSPQDRQLLSQVEGVVVPQEPSITTYTIKLNSKVGPTSDVHVRRALSYAFDYEAMLQVMSGFATRIAGPLPLSITGAVQEPAYETNLDKAREELAKSEEWADGFDIEFVYVAGLDEERQTGQILLDQLRELNINVKITPMEWANAVALFEDPETSPAMFPIYSGSDFPDPDNYLWQSFHSSSAGTWTGADHYVNPDIDKLLEDGRSNPNEDERIAIYDEAQTILIDEAVELYLFASIEGMVHRDSVQGYQYCPVMGSDVSFYTISLSE